MPQIVKVRSSDAIALKAIRANDDGQPVLTWEHELGNRYGVARMALTTDLGFRPGEDDYVEITRTDGVTREFSGIAVEPAASDVPGERTLGYELHAQGFGALLERIVLAADISWPADTTDRKMFDDLVALYWAPIGTGVTHDIRVRRIRMPAMSFTRGQSLRAVFDAIAKEAWDAPYYVRGKSLYYNAAPAAPYVLWAPATGGALKSLTHADFASFERLDDGRAGAQKALRVRVVGNAVEATVTDWSSFGRVDRRLRDEPNAPSGRFWQLPDITDTSLTTVEQCERRGYAELAKNAGRRSLTVDVQREGFAVGQRVDVVDEEIGTLATTLPRWTGRWRSYSGKRLYKGQGRFQIQRIEAECLAENEWGYRLELGAYVQPFETGLARN